MLRGEVCAYCERKTEKVSSAEVYGTDEPDYGTMYLCRRCDAWVGCHKGTDNALGRVADASLRFWKGKAHEDDSQPIIATAAIIRPANAATPPQFERSQLNNFCIC